MPTAPLPATELARLVFTDDLTGLYNRRFLHRYFAREIDWVPARPDTVALVMVDLDAFKSINDTWGHLEGDAVLKRTAQGLRASFRETDLVIRYAGDEFTIVMPGASREDALRRAEQARQALEREAFQRKGEAATGVIRLSAGVALFPDDADTLEGLIEKADKALYWSKTRGKGRVSDAAVTAREPSGGPPPRLASPAARGTPERLAEFLRPLDGADGAPASFLLVRGPAGAGKVRFLSDLVEAAGRRGAACFIEACSVVEQDVPYRPLTELLDKLCYRDVPALARMRAALSPDELAVLARDVPTLARALPDLAPPADLAPARRQILLFDGLVAALRALAPERPLCLLLDDFQNADEGTLHVLRAILDEPAGRVLLCGAVDRASAAGEPDRAVETPADRFVEEYRAAGRVSLLALEPLGLADVSAFLSELLPGREPAPEFDRFLLELSGGRRLYLEAAVRVLVARGLVRHADGRWDTSGVRREHLPVTLADLVKSQIALLDKTAGTVIAEAAVVGTRFRLDLLKRVAGTNEGEMLQVLDRARDLRLVDPALRSDDSEFAFVSPEAQDETYRGTPEAFRAETHARVAGAIEEIYRDNPEYAARALAWHYDKAGDAERAGRFRAAADAHARAIFEPAAVTRRLRERSGGLRVRIDERTGPVPDGEIPALLHVWRTVATAAKNVHVYPEGSQGILQAFDQLERAVARALEQVDGFTTGAGKEGVLLNGRAVDAKLAGAGGPEILKGFRERSLQSVTLLRGAAPAELRAFARLYGRPPEDAAVDPEAWSRALEEAGVARIGVVPKAFVVEEGSARETGLARRDVAASRDADALVRACRVVRCLQTAHDNLVRYPPGSTLIVHALDQLASSFQDFFARAETLAIGEADGEPLVNGVRPDPRALGPAGADFVRALRRAGIRSFVLSRESPLSEVEAFLRLVGATTEPRPLADWRALLKERGLARVWIGDTLFAEATTVLRRGAAPAPAAPAAAASTAAAAAPPAAPVPAAAPPGRLTGEDALRRAREICGWPPARQVAPETAAEAPRILELLLLDGHTDLASALVGKLLAVLRGPDPKLRERAADAVIEIHQKAAAPVREALLVAARDGVVEALRAETDAAPYRKLAPLGELVTLDAAVRRDGAMMTRAVWALAGARQAEAKELGKVAGEALGRLIAAPALQAWTRDIAAAPPETRGQALATLGHFGPAAAPLLVQMVRDTEDPAARRAAAQALRTAGPAAAARLLEEISRYAPRDACRRILGVVDEAGADARAAARDGLLHADDAVRREAVELLRRTDRAAALEVLTGLAALDDPAAAGVAIQALGDLRFAEAAPALVKRLKEAGDSHLQKALCVALGALGHAAAVPALTEVAEGRRLLGLKTAYPDEVRAAAVWALGKAGGAAARPVIERLANDKSPVVRSAAKLALGASERLARS